MTRICIPIFVEGGDIEDAIGQAEELLASASSDTGMIELRCDTASPRQMLAALDLVRVPAIVTVRPTWEGGFCQKSDKERFALFEAAIDAGVEFLDVELIAWETSKTLRETLSDLAAKHGTKLIISNHSVDGRPKDLTERLTRLRAVKEAAMLKIAWKAQSLLDAIDALCLSAENRDRTIDGRPLVALAMGEEGLISRLLAGKLGAPFTFASAATGKESAPGQPTVSDLATLYRWDKQSIDMPVFGVVGWPVGHSLSPHIHNAGFTAVDAPGVYVPLAIQPSYEAFQTAIDALRACPHMNLRGLSVTIPHKENAFRYVAENAGVIDDVSHRIGAVNTIVFPPPEKLEARNSKLETHPSFHGFNTDYAGALDALVTAWSGKREDVQGKRVAVIGAGGVARAIVAGLTAYGAIIIIYNRTFEKAQALAAEFPGVATATMDQLASSAPSDAYINCTPLGMHPRTNASPLDNLNVPFHSSMVVFDTVYNPRMTKLLKQARKQGATIVTGNEMFVRQAAIQFQAFTGKSAPLDVFRKVLATTLTR
ncbi:MAG: type I 3-dehydroquinate dehydratase [Phycisphaerales bacterium]|nr:type I 3-dehydroquinate dehydratase [Phycisphaerales bacterium]